MRYESRSRLRTPIAAVLAASLTAATIARASRADCDTKPKVVVTLHILESIAREIGGRVRGAESERWTKNRKAFDKKLEKFLAGGLMKKAAPLVGAKLLADRKSWAYFAQAWGCELVGYIEPTPGIPPTPTHLEELERTARTMGAKVILVTSGEPLRQAEELAGKLGGRVVVAPSDVGALGTRDWFDFQEMLVTRVVEALVPASERARGPGRGPVHPSS